MNAIRQFMEVMLDVIQNDDVPETNRIFVVTKLLKHAISEMDSSRSEPTDKGFETQGLQETKECEWCGAWHRPLSCCVSKE